MKVTVWQKYQVQGTDVRIVHRLQCSSIEIVDGTLIGSNLRGLPIFSFSPKIWSHFMDDESAVEEPEIDDPR